MFLTSYQVEVSLYVPDLLSRLLFHTYYTLYIPPSPAPLSFMIRAMARWTARSRGDGESMVQLRLRVSARMTGNNGSRKTDLRSVKLILF